MLVIGAACTVVVADAADLALHFFRGSDGTYLRSTYLGGRDSSVVAKIAGVASYDGTVAVGDATRESVVLVSEAGGTIRRIRLVAQASAGFTARLALWRDNTILERALPVPGNPGGAVARMWDSSGMLLRQIGAETAYENESLQLAMNDGALAVHRDTLWFGRFSDGRIFGYALHGRSSEQPRVIELPLFYEMDAPTFVVARRETGNQTGFLPAQVRHHLRVFTIDEHGSFLVVQMRADGSTVIASMAREGDTYRVFDVGGRVRAIAAGGGSVFAAVSQTGATQGAQLLRFDLPYQQRGACGVTPPLR